MTHQAEQPGSHPEAIPADTVEQRRRALLAKLAAGALGAPVVLSAIVSTAAAFSN